MSVVKVRKAMKSLIEATKKLKQSRTKDAFVETDFNFYYESISYGEQRQMGAFTIGYLVSPVPDSTSSAPSITYDEIIQVFKQGYAQAFIDNELILINYAYQQGDIITDPESGTVSLGFQINIKVVDKN